MRLLASRPHVKLFQARSISDEKGLSIRPPAKTRSIWQSSTERQGTEKSCLRKVKQRWLSLDMANRQSERRPADVHLRAEGNREQVAESEKSLKVWRRPKFDSQEKDQVGHTMWTRARFQGPMFIPERNSKRKPDCTSQAGGKIVNEAED